jgi:predicted urease superfamily metal-dependent hydrolase
MEQKVEAREGNLLILALVLMLSFPGLQSLAGGETIKEAKARGEAMLKDAENMVAHGGMGDTKAIVHHCAEVTKHAEAILKAVPPIGTHVQELHAALQEAIKHCKRVANLGDRVDPGVALNPATKARAAVREAVKHLALINDDSSH